MKISKSDIKIKKWQTKNSYLRLMIFFVFLILVLPYLGIYDRIDFYLYIFSFLFFILFIFLYFLQESKTFSKKKKRLKEKIIYKE